MKGNNPIRLVQGCGSAERLIGELPNDTPVVRLEAPTDVFVEMFYPNIYPADGPLTRITIGMCHVRAANTFTVEFDSERNGYVCRMDRTRDLGGMEDTVQKDVEVAFVPAWLEVET